MSNSEHHADDTGALFDRVLVEYLQQIDAGEDVDREQFIAAHPEVADELRDYFRTADDVEHLRQREPAATLDSDSASDTATSPLVTIRYFGDYELLEEIARGGMGVVYKARQASLNRTVALKMILAGQLASEEDVQRFRAEAEAAANLDHPGIVPIYEVGIHNGQHYFSMGYIEGSSLAARIVDGPIPPREAAEATQRVAEAVAYAHGHGVIHRDLKPANVLLDKHGHPRVTDFGLAKRVQADSDMTRSGQILGTPSYMPPEQASGRIDAIKETADVYALGAILYALLTGRPPFQADNQLDTLMQVLEREPVGPQVLNPKIPKDLETICLKCLEKEPSKRYESATEVTQELQCFLEGRPIKARPIGPARRAMRWCRRKPVVATLLALLAASMVIGTSVSLFWARRAEIKANESTANANRAGESEKRANKEATKAKANEATAKANEAMAKANEMMARRHFYAGQMNLAQRAIEDGRLARAKTFLSTQIPENTGGVNLRGFEWYLMWQKAHPELRTFEGSRFATLNPDGRLVATTPSILGTSVVVWDTRDGELYRSYSIAPGMTSRQVTDTYPIGQRPYTLDAAFSPDGRTLAAILESGEVILWDVGTGDIQHRFVAHDSRGVAQKRRIERAPSSCISFTPDGEFLVTNGYDALMKLWQLSDFEMAHVVDNVRGKPAISSDSRYIAVAMNHDERTRKLPENPDPSEFGRWRQQGYGLKVIDLEQAGDCRKLRATYCQSLAFCSNGSSLVVGTSFSSRVFVLDVVSETGSVLVDEISYESGVSSLALSPDSTRLVTLGKDGLLRLWDARFGGELSVWTGRNKKGQFVEPTFEPAIYSTASDIQFSPDGQRWLTVGFGEIKLWSVNIAPPISIDGVFHAGGCAVAEDGETVTMGSIVFNLPSGQITRNSRLQSPMIAPSGDLESTVSGDGSRYAWCSESGAIEVWDVERNQRLLNTQSEEEAIALSLDHDGGRLAHAAYKENARQQGHSDYRWARIDIWDVDTGVRTQTIDIRGTVLDVDFSANSTRFAALTYFSGITIWETDTWTKERTLKPPERSGLSSMAISSSGNLIAAYDDRNDRIIHWHAEEEYEPHMITDVDGRLGYQGGDRNRFVFTPQEDRLLFSSGNRVRVWDVISGAEVFQIDQRRVGRIAFDGNGELLLWGAEVLDARPLTDEVKCEHEARHLVEFLNSPKPYLNSPKADLPGCIWSRTRRKQHWPRKTAVLQSIAGNMTISEEVRQCALEIAKQYDDVDSAFTLGFGRPVPLPANLPREEYEYALAAIETAIRHIDVTLAKFADASPEERDRNQRSLENIAQYKKQLLPSLGTAHYRLGNYELAAAEFADFLDYKSAQPAEQSEEEFARGVEFFLAGEEVIAEGERKRLTALLNFERVYEIFESRLFLAMCKFQLDQEEAALAELNLARSLLAECYPAEMIDDFESDNPWSAAVLREAEELIEGQ